VLFALSSELADHSANPTLRTATAYLDP